jgi:hypothetical protein
MIKISDENIEISGTPSSIKKGLTYLFDKIQKKDVLLWSWIQWRTSRDLLEKIDLSNQSLVRALGFFDSLSKIKELQGIKDTQEYQLMYKTIGRLKHINKSIKR